MRPFLAQAKICLFCLYRLAQYKGSLVFSYFNVTSVYLKNVFSSGVWDFLLFSFYSWVKLL